jgi:hypothetical protein
MPSRRRRPVFRPSEYVIRNVLIRVDPVQLNRALQRWNEAYAGQDQSLAIPVLETIDIEGKDITADALLTQRALAEYLVSDRKAHLSVHRERQPSRDSSRISSSSSRIKIQTSRTTCSYRLPRTPTHYSNYAEKYCDTRMAYDKHLLSLIAGNVTYKAVLNRVPRATLELYG